MPSTSFCAFSPETFRASSPCKSASVCSGWRRSWLAAAKKRDFAALAISASRFAAAKSSAVARRAVMSAKVMTIPSIPPLCAR